MLNQGQNGANCEGNNFGNANQNVQKMWNIQKKNFKKLRNLMREEKLWANQKGHRKEFEGQARGEQTVQKVLNLGKHN